MTDPVDQPACDIAAAALSGPGAPASLPGEWPCDAFDPLLWSAAAPALLRLLGLYQDWSADPARHQALLAAWRRGIAFELSGD